MFYGIPLSDLTAPGLLLISVLMVFLGLLVPRYLYKEKVQEAKDWKKAYEIERDARALSDAQTAKLVEVTKTTHDIVAAIYSTATRLRESGGADVVSSQN